MIDLTRSVGSCAPYMTAEQLARLREAVAERPQDRQRQDYTEIIRAAETLHAQRVDPTGLGEASESTLFRLALSI
jgi:hypothetical protein